MGGDLRWQRPAAMHWQQDRRCAEKAREPTGLANVPPHAYVAWEYLRSLVSATIRPRVAPGGEGDRATDVSGANGRLGAVSLRPLARGRHQSSDVGGRRRRNSKGLAVGRREGLRGEMEGG